jgi:hypothetical protein
VDAKRVERDGRRLVPIETTTDRVLVVAKHQRSALDPAPASRIPVVSEVPTNVCVCGGGA